MQVGGGGGILALRKEGRSVLENARGHWIPLGGYYKRVFNLRQTSVLDIPLGQLSDF